jgi:hypothetical protein
VDFVLCQGLIVANITEAFYGAEGRHAPLQHFFLDGFGPGTGLFKCGQGEGRSAFAVA